MERKAKSPTPGKNGAKASRGRKPGAGKGAGPKGQQSAPVELGGPKGPEPTRYGDWEKGGRCTDF